MEENKTTPKAQPKKAGLFTLLIGFFLIIRGGMRLFEGNLDTIQIAFGSLMVIVGVAGIVYYFMKK